MRFWKKLWREKEKNPILVYPGLRYTHKKLNFACKLFFSKNVCLNTKINLRLKKNTKKFQFQKYLEKFLSSPSKKMLVIQFPYMEIVWLVFFFRKQKQKKSKFSVVAAQKTLKLFASSWIDCSKLFFHNFFFNSYHTISIYGNCMVSIFFHTIFFPFFMKRYQFRYQINYKIPLKFD